MAADRASDIVFVYGALRSGTTMFRLMLDCHPEVHNPGEADFLFDFLKPDPQRPTGWSYDRDRLTADRIFRHSGLSLPAEIDGLDLLFALLNDLADTQKSVTALNVHRNASRIAKALPTARIIHMLRDPRDVARSTVGMGWAGNSYLGSGSWRATEEDWEQAEFPEDSVLTLRFEDLMADLEPQLSRVTDFLGVPFDAAMLEYHLSTTYGPPDPGIAQQWRRKATPREVGLIEVATGPLMAARGYPPEHMRPAPGALEEGLLRAEHRLKRWRFNIGRFGFLLFSGRHLARLLNLNGLEKNLAARQEEIVIRNRK